MNVLRVYFQTIALAARDLFLLQNIFVWKTVMSEATLNPGVYFSFPVER